MGLIITNTRKHASVYCISISQTSPNQSEGTHFILTKILDTYRNLFLSDFNQIKLPRDSGVKRYNLTLRLVVNFLFNEQTFFTTVKNNFHRWELETFINITWWNSSLWLSGFYGPLYKFIRAPQPRRDLMHLLKCTDNIFNEVDLVDMILRSRPDTLKLIIFLYSCSVEIVILFT